MIKVIASSLLFLLVSSAVQGDCITLKNGKTYTGRQLSYADGVVTFETVKGTVLINKADIDTVVENVSVVDLYYQKKEKTKTAADHYDLALWCFKNSFRRAGIAERLKAIELDAGIESKCDNKIPESFYIRPPAEKKENNVSPYKVLTGLRRSWNNTEKAEKYKEKLKICDIETKKKALIKQLTYKSKKNNKFRGFVLEELGKINTVDMDVYSKHFLREPESSLREKTFAIMNTRYLKKDPVKYKAFEDKMMKTVLFSRNLTERLNAVESIGYMRSYRGVWTILKRIKIIWIGNGTRAHIMVGTVHSYIRDVTPVVATGATSFDPEIDTYNTASVLEVRIRSVEAEMIWKTLRSVTGKSFDQPTEWFHWWNTEGQYRL